MEELATLWLAASERKVGLSNNIHLICIVECSGFFCSRFCACSGLTVWGIVGYTVISTLLPHESEDHLLVKGIKVARTDVTNEESVLELKSFTNSLTMGKLDILINNA